MTDKTLVPPKYIGENGDWFEGAACEYGGQVVPYQTAQVMYERDKLKELVAAQEQRIAGLEKQRDQWRNLAKSYCADAGCAKCADDLAEQPPKGGI